MARAPAAKKKTLSKNRPTKKVAVKNTTTKKSAHSSKAAPKVAQGVWVKTPQKSAFEEKFGEGTAFDLDYGKLLIIALCVYIAIKVS